MGDRDWGVNWDTALQDCDCVACSTFAVDKTGAVLVG